MGEFLAGSHQQASPYLPSSAGIYILHLHLDNQHDLQIGRLGKFTFPPGEYLYVGSARGPGGIAARLGRHLRENGRCHWHIDWLRRVAEISGYFYLVTNDNLECTWSQCLAEQPGAHFPAPGFGASDCSKIKNRCIAHLLQFGASFFTGGIRDILPAVKGSRPGYHSFIFHSQADLRYIE